MKEYTTPDLLTDADETDIMKRMVEDMPIDIDVSEGSVAYDLLHPTAVEVERMKQFDLAAVRRRRSLGLSWRGTGAAEKAADCCQRETDDYGRSGNGDPGRRPVCD